MRHVSLPVFRIIIAGSLAFGLLSLSKAQVCNDWVQVSLADSCTVIVTPDMVLEGPPGDSNFVVQLFNNQGVFIGHRLTAAHLGDTIRAVVTHAPSGSSCMSRIVAVDALAPALHCVPLYVPCALPDHSPHFLSAQVGLSDAFPKVVEACGTFTLAYLDSTETFNCTSSSALYGRIWRKWTAKDAAGNVADCIQPIVIERVALDSVFFPADTSLDCGIGLPLPARTGSPAVWFGQKVWALLPAASACAPSVFYEDVEAPICPGTYVLLRTWSVHDACLPSGAGSRRHTQRIVVRDNAGPQLRCPADTLLYSDPFTCSRSWVLPEMRLSDACSGVESISVRWGTGKGEWSRPGILVPLPGASDTVGFWADAVPLPVGEKIGFVYVATDRCGNTASCSFEVLVADGSPPSVQCKQITQVALGSGGEAWVPAATFDAGSTDYCAPVRFKVRRADPSDCQDGNSFFDRVRFCCSDVGKDVRVVLRAYDVPVSKGALGLETYERQANDCEVVVRVVDKLKPVCSIVPQVQVSCALFDPTLEAYARPTFTDNCCIGEVVELPADYADFDTLCSRGTIVRTFRAVDCHGNSSSCTQRIVVTYEPRYAIRFPDDLPVGDCDSSGLYPPAPQVLGASCAHVGISYRDRVHEAGKLACYWIEREWRVVDGCRYSPHLPLVEVPNPTPSDYLLSPENLPGPTVAPPNFSPPATRHIVRPGDAQPTDFSVFWSPDANGYLYRQIILIRDSVPPNYRGCPTGPVQVCDHTGNDPNLWSAPAWKHPDIPDYTDLCEVSVDLAVSAQDKCSKGNLNIRYRLFLDLDGDGVQETVINSSDPLPAGMVRYGNAFTPDFAGGVLRPFDGRPVPPEEKYRFTLLSGGFSVVSGFLRWNTQKEPLQYVLPQLPHGTHRIEWTADDGCGNRSVCAYTIEIRDCRPPDLLCLQGLSINLPNGHPQTLQVPDFLLLAIDNCTPTAFVQTAVRRAGTGQGFPLLPDGSPRQTVRFECADLGVQQVEVWARDATGNAAFCRADIRVQDPMNACSATHAKVAGRLFTHYQQNLQGATVSILGSSGSTNTALNAITDEEGRFSFNAIPTGADYRILPSKNDDPLNGVSTYDLMLLNQHIIGHKPLDHPYKIIAADANNSRSVTTADIVELRKLILGLYTQLPAAPSWRFVAADYVFPNPNNPFQEIFPEQRFLKDLSADALSEHFVAIKVGDLNGNAITGSLHAVQERAPDTVGLHVYPVYPQALTDPSPERREMELLFEAEKPLCALQGTFHHLGWKLTAIEPAANMSAEHFALFPQQHLFTVAWEGSGRPAWRVKFKATGADLAEQHLYLSSAVTPAMAFADTPDPLRLRLHVGTTPSAAEESPLKVYGVEPNPCGEQALLRFFVSRPTDILLDIIDLTGKTRFSQKSHFAAGLQTIELQPALQQAPPGMYFFRLSAQGKSVGGKILKN